MYLLDRCVGVDPHWKDPCIGVGLKPSTTTGLGRGKGSDAALDASSSSDSAFLESSSGEKKLSKKSAYVSSQRQTNFIPGRSTY